MRTATGKSRGFKKGDFVMTPAFPGIIVSDVHTFAPCCEVWGFEHESGSAYASEMIKITKEEFVNCLKELGYKQFDAWSDIAKKTLIEAGLYLDTTRTTGINQMVNVVEDK